MRAGILDRLITIQRNTSSTGPDGHPTDSWTTVDPLRRPAALKPVSGEERFTAPQFVAREQVTFQIRYDASVVSLNPLDRIIYPALSADSPPVTREVYDVVSVDEVGRREGLLILAARRSDVPT